MLSSNQQTLLAWGWGKCYNAGIKNHLIKRDTMHIKELSELIKVAIVAAGPKGKFLSAIQKEFRKRNIRASDGSFRAARNILIHIGAVIRSGNGLLVAKQFATPAKTATSQPKKPTRTSKMPNKHDKGLTKMLVLEKIDDFIDEVFDEVANIVATVSADTTAGVEPCNCQSSYFTKVLDLAVECGLLAKHVIYTSPKFGQMPRKAMKK